MELLPADRDALLALLWPRASLAAAHADVARWFRQGFELLPADGAFPLGLVQGHGGPCGVLAAVQAELLRRVLFSASSPSSSSDSDVSERLRTHLQIDKRPEAAQEQQELVLAEALASLLVLMRRGVGDDVRIVLLDGVNADQLDLSAVRFTETVLSISGATEDAATSIVARVVLHNMAAFRRASGVMSFVCSVLRTKTVARVRDEMDDRDATLTAQFGHCGQELLNLLLTGRAVSNVFDGSVPMGDTGLMLRGVQQRARVGYLTQLEALRYCQVGSFYKTPEVPIWVVGSASHFSVGFALDAAVCRESPSEALFQRVQRVFKSFDPMETGFMEIGVLAQSLKQLGVSSEILSNDYWMARLLAKLEMAEGAGIVLWDEYWKVISVLLHTGDFELALSGQYGATASGQNAARRPRSDSDLARELQAQFDVEQGGGASAGSTSLEAASTAPPDKQASAGAAGQAAGSTRPLEFDWYYYNGLRVGNGSSSPSAGDRRVRQPELARCRVKLQSASEFIGKSVPILDVGASGGHGSPPLEEILKTKWPNAELVWAAGVVPSVD